MRYYSIPKSLYTNSIKAKTIKINLYFNKIYLKKLTNYYIIKNLLHNIFD